MFKYFKNRHKAVTEAYGRGYKEAWSKVAKAKDLELKRLKKNIKEVLERKNKEIAKKNKRVKDIEAHLLSMSPMFAAFKQLAMMAESEDMVTFKQVLEKHKEHITLTTGIISTYDVWEKEFPKLLEKLENYCVEENR